MHCGRVVGEAHRPFAGLGAGGAGQHLEAKKGKKTDFSLEPPGKQADLLLSWEKTRELFFLAFS